MLVGGDEEELREVKDKTHALNAVKCKVWVAAAGFGNNTTVSRDKNKRQVQRAASRFR